MEEMNYEMLLRKAFEFSLDIVIGRAGDPAQLADANHFRNDNLELVKIGTGYAMEIYVNDILYKKIVDEQEYDRIEIFPASVVKATSLNEISDLIEEFNFSVIDAYY